MKCYTMRGGRIETGIEIQTDDRLGPVVFLGEEGRGRRYEKVGLDRKSPAPMVEGRVMEADPTTITLPPRDGKAEKKFVVLGRAHGHQGDYGHMTILIGPYVAEEVFPEIVAWLTKG